MKRKIILILCLLKVTGEAFPQEDFQEGFIITINNDTVKGFIDRNSDNFNNCHFRENNQSKTSIYLPNEIKSFGITNSGYFISRTIRIKKSYIIYKELVEPNGSTNNPKYKVWPQDTGYIEKSVFIEYLLNGIVKIYYYKNKTNNYYFMEKDSLIDITPNTYRVKEGEYSFDEESKNSKGRIISIMSDCPQLTNEISNSSIYYDDLIKIGKKYHNYMCSDYECIVYHKKRKPFKISFLMSSGIGYSRIKLNSYQIIGAYKKKYIFYDYLGYNFGANFYLNNLFPTAKKISGKFGLNLRYNEYKSDYRGDLDFYVFGSDVGSMTCYSKNVEYNAILIHKLSTNIKSPFIEYGFDILLSSNRSEISLLNTHFTKSITNEFNDYDFGLLLGGGYEFPINKQKHRLILELSYKQLLRQSNVNLMIGYKL